MKTLSNVIECDDNNEELFVSNQLITYLGNKRSLLEFIDKPFKDILKKYKRKLNILDGFSGSGVVARYLKRYAKTLYTNDLEIYSEIINKCYLTNKTAVDINRIASLISDADAWVCKNLTSGFITDMYSPKDETDIKDGERVFYSRRNAMYIDTMRQYIDREIDEKYRPFLIAPLLSEASIHTNTSGVFKGFYKNKNGVGQFGGENRDATNRILGNIKISEPILSNHDCGSNVFRMDTNEVVKKIKDLDVAYFDPPYNQHPYGSNYFMLTLIANYKKPEEVSTVSGIPSNWNRSDYNKKQQVNSAIKSLVADCTAKHILFSYNSEGYVCQDDFKSILEDFGKVKVYKKEYNAFRGSRNLSSRSLKVDEIIFSLQKE